jgi:hypothetical protein
LFVGKRELPNWAAVIEELKARIRNWADVGSIHLADLAAFVITRSQF